MRSSLLCGLDQALCCTQAQAARVLDCWGPTWGLLLVVSVSDYCPDLWVMMSSCTRGAEMDNADNAEARELAAPKPNCPARKSCKECSKSALPCQCAPGVRSFAVVQPRVTVMGTYAHVSNAADCPG